MPKRRAIPTTLHVPLVRRVVIYVHTYIHSTHYNGVPPSRRRRPRNHTTVQRRASQAKRLGRPSQGDRRSLGLRGRRACIALYAPQHSPAPAKLQTCTHTLCVVDAHASAYGIVAGHTMSVHFWEAGTFPPFVFSQMPTSTRSTFDRSMLLFAGMPCTSVTSSMNLPYRLAKL